MVREKRDLDDRDQRGDRDENRDPISGEKGAHPVGAGVGAALGGAAAGAAAGAVAGPVGAAVGAVVGGVVGGYAGKGVAESIDPTVEDAYWQSNYHSRPYYDPDIDYDEFAPAYRYGYESRARHPDRSFDDLEGELGTGWGKARGSSTIEWDNARLAARDAWDRVDDQYSTMDPPKSPPRKG